MKRGAPPNPKPECVPFAFVFREFREEERPAVQLAIDALVVSHRSVSVLRVREYLAGVLPDKDRPPVVVAKRQPPIVETVQPAAPPDFNEAAQMARTASTITAQRTQGRMSDFRARVAHAERLLAAGEDCAEASRPWLTIDGWGLSPGANRYEGEDTWRFRLAELFAPLQKRECGG